MQRPNTCISMLHSLLVLGQHAVGNIVNQGITDFDDCILHEILCTSQSVDPWTVTLYDFKSRTKPSFSLKSCLAYVPFRKASQQGFLDCLILKTSTGSRFVRSPYYFIYEV